MKLAQKMEDFDVFTNEIDFTKPLYTNILNKFVHDIPKTPNGPNYQSSQKLLAEECLVDNDDLQCSFHLSESMAATFRTLAVYRDEQLKSSCDKTHQIRSCIKPVSKLINSCPKSEKTDGFFELPKSDQEVSETLKKSELEEEPLHMKYLRFTEDTNVSNFQKILKELPKEWTIVQITAPYNPNENLMSRNEFRVEIYSIILSVFTNAYLDDDVGPFNVHIPANVHKEGEKPLFTELYSLLEDNYKTIENAQFLNNKRLVQNYWNRRDDIDLRMKSVISIMDREWLSGWTCLMTGKLMDSSLSDRIKTLVDTTITDWGFIRLTQKQRILLYNLIESSSNLSSSQIKCCIRRILTEHGNPDDIRQLLDTEDCTNCTTEFNLINELCSKCLAKCFEKIHHFTVVDGIRAFSKAATQVREYDEWATLKTAKRYPVILIVDEMLDTFPWESLPFLNTHPVSRMENLHFLYYLYKVHESKIVEGYIQTKAEDGRYVINPERNLERMEKRMRSFVEYWMPAWIGAINCVPPPEDFLAYLQTAQLFLYCGHGDGSHLGGGGAGVERTRRGGGAALLAGCGSARLSAPSDRAACVGAHHTHHIAHCPLIIGMLWEVTDLEVDKVVTSLLALCVPGPPGAVPWEAVGKAKWGQGILETKVETKVEFQPERDLLSAVSRARRSTSYVMIASSVVARGLPVRITEES